MTDRDVLSTWDAAAAQYIATVPPADRSSEQARLDAQKVVIASLGAGDELAPYPDAKTVSDVIREGLVRPKRARAAVADEEAKR